MTGQSEGLDVDTDGRHIGLVAVGKEADDAAVVHDGDVEGLGFLDGVTDSERSVGPEVGDDGEAGDAVAPVNRRSRRARELPSRTRQGQG